MSRENRNFIRKWTTTIVGMLGFCFQSYRLISGNYSNKWYEELIILVVFVGISLRPILIVKALISKLNNVNIMREEAVTENEKEVVKPTETAKESVPENDEEV